MTDHAPRASEVCSGYAIMHQSPETREKVFVVLGLTKVYEMGEVKVHALRGVNFELLSGELVVLLGPSGSGSPRFWKS